MKASSILEAFSKIDGTLQIEADTTAETKPQAFRRLRFAAIAATFAIIVLLIPIVVILANRTAQPPIPPIPSTSTSTPPSTTPTHLSITDIPGATLLFDIDQLPSPIDDSANFHDKMTFDQGKQWVKNIQTMYASILGSVTNIESVKIETDSGFYHISRITMKITTPLYNTDESDTITAIYACQYQLIGNDYQNISKYHMVDHFYCSHDMGWLARFWTTSNNDPTGVCLFESAQGHEITVQDKTYDLSDYADYYMIAYMRYDEVGGMVGMSKCGGFPYEWLISPSTETD